MKKLVLSLFLLWASGLMLQAQVWPYVDPRIGSEGLGRTFPGPSMPFGMVKPGPDCGVLPNAGWAPMPEPVVGFSQTHVSGTGGGQKYGNVLLQPFAEGVLPNPYPWPAYPQRRTSETVALGYYATTFESGVATEVTTAERCALYRFHYPQASTARLWVDATHFLGKDAVPNLRERQQLVGASLGVSGPCEITGSTTVRGGWNNGDAYTVYFCLQADRAFRATVDSAGQRAVLSFADTLVGVKVGLSYVSLQQARRNIVSVEFDAQLSALRQAWQPLLGQVRVEGTPEQKRMFYTALYHTMLMPVDKTGEYPRPDGREAASGTPAPYYDDYYAIWDTYRTSVPLLTLLCPDRQTAMVNSLLYIYAREGYMPDARSGDCNGRTQGGSNAEVVVADAFAKGLGRDPRQLGFPMPKGETIDYALALEAMIKDATVPPADAEREGRGGLAEYNRLGYIPYGIDRAGNRTVEYAFDDWCIAQVARGLGRRQLYKEYMAKSRSWRNLWRADYEYDGMRGFILPKDDRGRWMDSVPWGHSQVFHPTIPYTPVTKVAPWYLPWWATFFYEATSEEYSLSIPHDVPGLIQACGGKRAFRQRLDNFFAKKYYNVANEPSFLTPCLYHWIGRPDLSTERIHQIVADHYTDRPDGLPGNDDSGAMSSWLAFHMMGLYPLAGSDVYLLNVPLLPTCTLSLANGRTLRVEQEGRGSAFEAYLNGQRLKRARLTHAQLMQGGVLVFRRHPVAPDGAAATAHEETASVAPSPAAEAAEAQPAPLPVGQQTGPTPGPAEGTATVSFTLNRQFRTWPLAYAWEGDTLALVCKATSYRIPRHVVDHATGFCWLSPQDDGAVHHDVQGTFLFISRDALRNLLANGHFGYDDITWRLVEQTDSDCLVRADTDGTEMRIATTAALPLVLDMRQNPLGIDWTLTPTAPPAELTTRQLGIPSDGITLCTPSLQQAIDRLAEQGGGRLTLTPGRYLTGSLLLRSGVELHVEEGAVLLGSTNPYDYPLMTTELTADARNDNASMALIMADRAEHLRITGRGMIDGQGLQLALNADSLHHTGEHPDAHYNVRRQRPSELVRPKLFFFYRCRDVRVDGLHLRNSANWGLSFDLCEQLVLQNLDVENRAYWNNDGIDLTDCRHVVVSNCRINAADDGVCLKSYHTTAPPCSVCGDTTATAHDIEVGNCHIRSSASAVKFGTASWGAFRKVHVHDIRIADTFRSCVAIESVDGGLIDSILVENIAATRTGNALFLRLGQRAGEHKGALRNVVIRNLQCEVPFERPDEDYDLRGPEVDFFHNPFPASICGIPDNPIENVLLENIDISYPGRATRGMAYMPLWRVGDVPEQVQKYPEFSMFGELPAWAFYVRHARNVVFRHVRLTLRDSDFRPAFVFDDVQGASLQHVNQPLSQVYAVRSTLETLHP